MRAAKNKIRILSIGLIGLVTVGCAANRHQEIDRSPLPSEQTGQSGWLRKLAYVTSNTNRFGVFDNPSQWPSKPPEEVVQSRFVQMFPNLSRRVARTQPVNPVAADFESVVASDSSPNSADETVTASTTHAAVADEISAAPSEPTRVSPEEWARLSQKSAGIVAVMAAVASSIDVSEPVAKSTETVAEPAAVATSEPNTSLPTAEQESPQPSDLPPMVESIASQGQSTNAGEVDIQAEKPVASPMIETASTAKQDQSTQAESVSPPVETAAAPIPAETSQPIDSIAGVKPPYPMPVAPAAAPAAKEIEIPGIAASEPSPSSATVDKAASPAEPVAAAAPIPSEVASSPNDSTPAIPGLPAEEIVATEPVTAPSPEVPQTAQPSETVANAPAPESVPDRILEVPPIAPINSVFSKFDEKPTEKVALGSSLPAPASADPSAASPLKEPSAQPSVTAEPPISPPAIAQNDAPSPEVLTVPGLPQSEAESRSSVPPEATTGAFQAGNVSVDSGPSIGLSAPASVSPNISIPSASDSLRVEVPQSIPAVAAPVVSGMPNAMTEPPPPAPAPELQVPGITGGPADPSAPVSPAADNPGPSPTDSGIERSSGTDAQSTENASVPSNESVQEEAADVSKSVEAGVGNAVPTNSHPLDAEAIPILQPLPDDESADLSLSPRPLVERRPGELVIRLRFSNPLRGYFRRIPDEIPQTDSSPRSLKDAARNLFAWQRNQEPEKSSSTIDPAFEPAGSESETQDTGVVSTPSAPDAQAAVASDASAEKSATVDSAVSGPSTAATAPISEVSENQAAPETSPETIAASTPETESRITQPLGASQVRVGGGLPPVEFPPSYSMKRPKSANPWYAHANPAVNLVSDPRTGMPQQSAQIPQPVKPQAPVIRKDASLVQTSFSTPVKNVSPGRSRTQPAKTVEKDGLSWWSRAGKSLKSIWSPDEEVVPPKRPGWATRPSIMP